MQVRSLDTLKVTMATKGIVVFAQNWPNIFKGVNFLYIFPTGPYILTMFIDGRHIDFPIAPKNITFVEVHPRTIHATFALN